MEVEETPRLVPARMLNEFVYCPRLFYLEWVDDRWADNDDTAAGQLVHRAVDRPGGRMPDPEEVELLRDVRSLRVESSELGVVAVIDRIVGGDGGVVPLDIKKGKPGHDGSPWPADRIQVLVQAVLLREAGYNVQKALLYYAETRQRVEVPLDDSATNEVIDIVKQARAVANQPRPPLPLVDSPKCPRCSLVGLCLPDETNALLERSSIPPRRIVPRDPDRRPLYVNEQGAYVGVRGGRVVVTKEGTTLVDARLIDVSQVCLSGNVHISPQALNKFWQHGVPVLWFSYGGWLRGWAQGEMSRYVELRRRQVAVHAQGAFDVARAMIEGKVRNSRTLLRRNARVDVHGTVDALGRLVVDVGRARGVPELLGLEGTAARLYFGAFPDMLGAARFHLAADFEANGRARRPAPDPVNALLGYCYGLLVKDLVAVCLAVGLDPYLGVLHRPRFGRPALALDLAEEFRPLVADSVVVNVLNNGEIADKHFLRRGDAVALTPDGRRSVLRAYERRLDVKVKHPVFGYKISYRRVMDVQARILAAVMVGELERYVPMTTR